MKERLDIILVNRGYAGSRNRARELILAGKVYVNGRAADKAGSFYDSDLAEIEVRGEDLKFVSRGGLKLEKALKKWQLALEGWVCMDIGASTGGFTDCMLQYGAAKVYSVDVGHDQLAEKLRLDSRVVCMEGVNFRYMSKADIREELDFASVDVSFISLTRILAPAGNLLRKGGQMVCLIKPQFEAGKGRVGKNGVVRDPGIHRQVIGEVMDYAFCAGFEILHLDYSPVRGPEGNIEYLLHLEKREERNAAEEETVAEMAAAGKQPDRRIESNREIELDRGIELDKRIEAGSSIEPYKESELKRACKFEMLQSLQWEQLISGTVEAAWKAI